MSEMSDVLQIVVHAFLRMKLADTQVKRRCIFVHQNVPAVNAAEKLATDRQKFQEQLDTRTKEASEAQDLPETITSFSRIISFDIDSDVVYFPDLWNGDPPMAVVNQGYSTRCAETRRKILKEVSTKFSGSIMITDFCTRVEDMWNGVLADDFVFSFRNTLAAKAYIGLERQVGRLKMLMEADILVWVNFNCKQQMDNCMTEDELENCFTRLMSELNTKMHGMLSDKQEDLLKLFEKHPAKEIIIQWKLEKVRSLCIFVDEQKYQIKEKLEREKQHRNFEIHHQTVTPAHAQEIMQEANDFAKKNGGSQLSNLELEGLFSGFWKPWSERLIAAPPEPTSNVANEMKEVALDLMDKDGNKKFMSNGECTWSRVIEPQNIASEYVRPRGFYGKVKSLFTLSQEDTRDAASAANDIMDYAIAEALRIATQDTKFDQHHAKQILGSVLDRIKEHNKEEKRKTSFTPTFSGIFLCHVTKYISPIFDKMNQQYEEKHGVTAKLEAYKMRVFNVFKNAVQKVQHEITAAEDLCEAIRPTIIDYVDVQLHQRVMQMLHEKMGTSKYDLITMMLDEIARKSSFDELYQYIQNSPDFAKGWMKEFGENEVFGKSKYSEYAQENVDTIITHVKNSANAATTAVSSEKCSNQYSAWIEKFCEELNDIAPLKPANIHVDASYEIDNFSQYMEFLSQKLEDLQKDICHAFKQVQASSVSWKGENPF